MKIYVPHTLISLETIRCLEPHDWLPLKMEGDDDYLRYFQACWRRGESFINCEHDTTFHASAIKELILCPEEWCAFGVMGRDAVWRMGRPVAEEEPFSVKQFVDGAIPTLALMKFDHRFIEKHPDLWNEMETADVEWKNMPRWMWCDMWLNEYTKSRGIVCHQHYPEVFNANPNYYGGELKSLLENYRRETDG